MILPDNARSQAVARRLGMSLAEERVLSSHSGRAPRHLADRAPAMEGVPAEPGPGRFWTAALIWSSGDGQRRARPPSTRTTSPVT